MRKSRSSKSDQKPSAGKSARRGGRPLSYTRKLADAVLELMQEPMSVRAACAQLGVPKSTFLRWVADDVDGLLDRYTRAQEVQALLMLDECVDIADDNTNDWIERTGRDGKKFLTLNTEHIRRCEVRIGYRRWFFEQVQAGGFRRKRDAGQDNASMDNIVAALGRMAARVQATGTI